MLRLPSDSGYVVAYAAAAKLGAVTAGINPRLAAEQDVLGRPGRPRGDAVRPRRGGRAGAGRAGPAVPCPGRRSSTPTRNAGGHRLPRARRGRPRARSSLRSAAGGGGPAGHGRRLAEGLPAMLASTVRPHRVHHQARLVPAAGDPHPSSGTGGPRTPPRPSPPSGCRRSAASLLSSHGPLAGGGAPRLVARPHGRGGRRRVAGPGERGAGAVRGRLLDPLPSTESGCGTGTAFDADDEEALHRGQPPPGRRGVGARRGRPPGRPG